METYLVTIKLGSDEREVYIQAPSATEALAAAMVGASSYELRWASFIL